MVTLMFALSLIVPSISNMLPTQQTSNTIALADEDAGIVGPGNPEGKSKKELDEEKEKEDKKDEDKDSDKEESESKDEEKDSEESGGSGSAKRGSAQPKDKLSVMYAQIIMGPAMKDMDEESKEDNPKAWELRKQAEKAVKDSFEGIVSGIIGDGGVSLDVNYSEMSYMNKEIMGRNTEEYEGGENGQALASFFRTFDKYGYINTVSGNSIVASGYDAINGVARLIGGLIAFIGLILYYAVNTLSSWLTKTLASLNPYHFVGFKQGEGIMPENPISKAISNFFNGFGLNGSFMTTIMELGLLFILFMLGISVIVKLMRVDFGGAGEAGKKWLIRLFVIFGAFPLMALTATGINKSVSDIAEMTKYDDAPAMSHLLDQRAWASGTNLSPNGLKNTNSPKSKAELRYIDKSYNPSTNKGRQLISDINSAGYKNLYGETDKTKIGFDLIGKWIVNGNYNVNTYMGDLRANASLPGVSNFKPLYASYKKVDQKVITNKQLKSAMWSSTQNVDEKGKDVTNNNYNPALEIGTMDDQAFSTQSVVLMLQSSFDETSAKFYAYNFAPSNNQANLKNLTTVKTEWKEISLPGDGVLGAIGSWLSMIAKSVAYVFIGTAVILALVTTNMFAAMIAFAKQILRALTFGSINSAMATFLIYLGGIFSVLIAVGMPGMFITLVQSIGDGVEKATNGYIPPGFVDIISSIIIMFFAWYLSFGAKIGGTDQTPVRLITTLPVKMAMDFEAKVAHLDRAGGNTDFKSMASGMGQSFRKNASNTSSQMSNRFGKDASGVARGGSNMAKVGVAGGKSGMKNIAKQGAIGSAKGAAVGLATGGFVGAAAGAGKGALQGSSKGAISSAKNTASDMKKAGKDGYKSGFQSRNSDGSQSQKDKNSNKANLTSILDARKASDAKANQAYSASDGLRDYNNERSKHLADSEAKGAKESAMKYGNMPYNIMPDQRLSEQTTADKDHMTRLTGDEDLYDNDSSADMRKYSATAGMSAKEAVDEYNKPMFSRDEFTKLRDSENEDEFVDNLRDTNRGMEYAMNSTNAKNALKDSRFTDDNNNISMDNINDFNNEIDRKFADGSMTEDDWNDKAKLDNAFVLGAQEKYRRPNNKFTDRLSTDNVDGAKSDANNSRVMGATGSTRRGGSARPQNERENSRAKRPQKSSMKDRGSMGSTGTASTSGAKTSGAKTSSAKAISSPGIGGPSSKGEGKSTQSKSTQSKSTTGKQQAKGSKKSRVVSEEEYNKKMTEKMREKQKQKRQDRRKRQQEAFKKQEKKQQDQFKKQSQQSKRQHEQQMKRNQSRAKQQRRNAQQQENKIYQQQAKENKRRQDEMRRQDKRPQVKRATVDDAKNRNNKNND